MDYTRKFTIERHLSSQAYLQKVGEGEPPAKKQSTIDTVIQPKSTHKKMHEDLIKAFVGMNIPLNNIDHPLFRAFLKEHVEGGSTVPSGSWVRRDMIPKIYEKEKAQIKASFEGVAVAVLADESTDVENRSVLNVLLKALIPDSKAILISVDFLEKVNASEVAQTIQRSLVDYNVEYQQVRVFVSDNAAYMKATFKVMKGFYVNMIHVTCWCHILSLVGNY